MKKEQQQSPHLLSMSLDELKEMLQSLGIKPFVASQIFSWVYDKHILDYAEMKNISKKDRDTLAAALPINIFKDVKEIESDESAVKLIGTLFDDKKVEFVVLRHDKHDTLCVSSQVGCPVDCKFCLTGIVGFKRQLQVFEIVGQVLTARNLGYPVSRLVFMGMGEPLLNYEAVKKAYHLLTAEHGLGISTRRVTISTSGFLKTLQRLIDDEWHVNLAFSVGSTDPLVRERIMPVEKQNPIMVFSRLLHDYLSQHNRKLTLEYTLLEGVNDSSLQLQGLVNLSKYLSAKINLINLNPHEKIPYKPVSLKRLQSIQASMKRDKIAVTIRYKKGQDIAAACGQLGDSI